MRHPAAGLVLKVHVVELVARQDVTTRGAEAMNPSGMFLHGCVHSLIMPETHAHPAERTVTTGVRVLLA
jgi:hypothetical protein